MTRPVISTGRAALRMTALLTLLLVPAVASAWGAAGHRALAQAGFEALTVRQQQALTPVLTAAPMVPKQLRNKPAAALAELAVWPDKTRSLTVAGLFKRYGSGQVPPALRAWQLRKTSNWHYRNERFVGADGKAISGRGCAPKPSGDLVKVFEALKLAFGEARDPRDRAVVMAFLLHLAGDAYQPLHRLAQVDSTCRHDRGGNGYCAVAGKGSRCQRNLHQLWDAGFGVFDSPIEAARPPRTLALAAGLDFNAQLIYPRRLPLTPDYEQRARAVVRDVAARAAGFNKLLLKQMGDCLARGRRCTKL